MKKKQKKDRKTLALALGSGSARGLAHIGVLQVLEENNIPVDAVSGCSMGAVIGSIYASGTDLHLLEKLLCEMNTNDLFDYSLPRSGLVKGNRFTQLIAVLTKNKTFEETNIPFSCVACDIRAGVTKNFTSGKVVDAVRASMSIPGVFQPVTLDGVLYVDGAVLQPVPVEQARLFGTDCVVAVDVGMQQLEEDIKETTPSILMRTLELMEMRGKRNEVQSADIVLNPKVRHTSKYSNNDAGETIAIGRQTALDALDEIKEALAL